MAAIAGERARKLVSSDAFKIGQAAQRAQSAGIEPVSVFDNQQWRLVFRCLLQCEHTDHRKEFTVGPKIGFVAELPQCSFEQSCSVESCTIDHCALLIVVARIDEMLDESGFSGQGWALQQGEPGRRFAGCANGLEPLKVRGIRYNRLLFALVAEGLFP
jgi:hypothetical protein